VLYKTIIDSIYLEQLSSDEKNILLWAALLHDISKRGPPEFTGRDLVHPFMSAKTTLEIFRFMNLFRLETSEE